MTCSYSFSWESQQNLQLHYSSHSNVVESKRNQSCNCKHQINAHRVFQESGESPRKHRTHENKITRAKKRQESSSATRRQALWKGLAACLRPSLHSRERLLHIITGLYLLPYCLSESSQPGSKPVVERDEKRNSLSTTTRTIYTRNEGQAKRCFFLSLGFSFLDFSRARVGGAGERAML